MLFNIPDIGRGAALPGNPSCVAATTAARETAAAAAAAPTDQITFLPHRLALCRFPTEGEEIPRNLFHHRVPLRITQGAS